MPQIRDRLAAARQRPLVRDAVERGIEARLIDTRARADHTVRAGMTVATVVVIAYSVVSCGGVLQRMYIAAWRLGAPAAGRFWIDMRAIWAIGFMLYVGATFAQPDASGDRWSAAVRDVARTAVAIGFFAWTPYVLLNRGSRPADCYPPR
jgi:hypothetical protein